MGIIGLLIFPVMVWKFVTSPVPSMVLTVATIAWRTVSMMTRLTGTQAGGSEKSPTSSRNAKMRGRFAPVKERLDRIRILRREIEELISKDRECRLPSGVVCWTDRKQHETRLARITEIKTELYILHVAKHEEM